MPCREGSLHGLKPDPSARAHDQNCRHGVMLPVGSAWLSVMCDAGRRTARWVDCLKRASKAVVAARGRLTWPSNSLHHRDRSARLRAGDPALWALPYDLLRGRQGAAALRAQGHDDYARPDAAGAGGDHRLAGNSAVAAAVDLTGILALRPGVKRCAGATLPLRLSVGGGQRPADA